MVKYIIKKNNRYLALSKQKNCPKQIYKKSIYSFSNINIIDKNERSHLKWICILTVSSWHVFPNRLWHAVIVIIEYFSLLDIDWYIVSNILRFIYQGEVVISPDQLDSFMDVAQQLQVEREEDGDCLSPPDPGEKAVRGRNQ